MASSATVRSTCGGGTRALPLPLTHTLALTLTLTPVRWDARERKMVPAQHLHAGGCTTFVRAWQLGARARMRTLLAVAVERTMVGGAAGSDGAAKLRWTSGHTTRKSFSPMTTSVV